MKLVIKSRKAGKTFHFWMSYDGGYIYLEEGDRIGCLGRQICHGGNFLGATISANPLSFESKCRKWYRAYLRNIGAS